MPIIVAYLESMSLLQHDHQMKHQGVFTPKEFQKIQEDLCQFLLREVCHDSRVYFDPWSELREQKYLPLVHWDKDGFFRTYSQEYGFPENMYETIVLDYMYP